MKLHIFGTMSLLATLSMCVAPTLLGQQQFPPDELDLTASATSPRLESAVHNPLPEQFIWAAEHEDDHHDKTFYFRKAFEVASVPKDATLYVAGPDQILVYLNGRLVENAERDPVSRLKPLVVQVPVAANLHAGSNLIAIEGSYGSRMAVKIVPRAMGMMAPALMMSDGHWLYSPREEQGWQTPTYDAADWATARDLGGVEDDIDFLRWNADAGMYKWPGYDGISPFLAHLSLPPEKVIRTFEGMGRLSKTDEISSSNPAAGATSQVQSLPNAFTVTLPPPGAPRNEDPYLLLDMGRESTGRLEVVSGSDTPIKIEIQYGESEGEAINEPYLGVNTLVIPPHAASDGAKSAFRYALIRFVDRGSPEQIKAIRLDCIYYPVKNEGSFESSDTHLNRIWLVGAYTSHLSMQDEIWDAPKRDRAPYGGDLNVSGRVIETAFGDKFMVRRTMDDLVPPPGVPGGDVNGIPGYTAFWVMDQADYYRHFGDRAYLASMHDRLLELLARMQSELNGHLEFADARGGWPFVDWSPDLFGDTPEVRRATTLEFAKAFAEGAWLLEEIDDTANAAKYRAEADRVKQAAREYLLDPATGTFGSRWETNAMAILSGIATKPQSEAIWNKVLSRPSQFMITPYYNYYVIEAMAESGHRKQALDWLREYWGGMIQEGATTFWEAYDPSWPKKDFHANLLADNMQGYYVSLCHGWSSGPTAWLTEQLLGIQPLGAGFTKMAIRPDLMGLRWAKGSEPTPHGLISIDLRATGDGLEANLSLPSDIDAQISLPAPAGATTLIVNGHAMKARPVENGARLAVDIKSAGSYRLRAGPGSR